MARTAAREGVDALKQRACRNILCWLGSGRSGEAIVEGFIRDGSFHSARIRLETTVMSRFATVDVADTTKKQVENVLGTFCGRLLGFEGSDYHGSLCLKLTIQHGQLAHHRLDEEETLRVVRGD
ncbi:MAG: hypothetical protein AAGF31_08780 [Planctomycetota bacterium]